MEEQNTGAKNSGEIMIDMPNSLAYNEAVNETPKQNATLRDHRGLQDALAGDDGQTCPRQQRLSCPRVEQGEAQTCYNE